MRALHNSSGTVEPLNGKSTHEIAVAVLHLLRGLKNYFSTNNFLSLKLFNHDPYDPYLEKINGQRTEIFDLRISI
jgi:hypothetical protein